MADARRLTLWDLVGVMNGTLWNRLLQLPVLAA